MASIFLQCGIEREIIKDFNTALLLSQPPSIDTFLEHRPEFTWAGKLAIAMSLIKCEVERKLNDSERRRDGIYHFLWTQLIAPWEEFRNNKLTIITFNYDRSLEHFIFTVIKNLYGKSDDSVAELMTHFPIIHVHGSLGPLPWQQTGGRPYLPIQINIANETIKQLEAASEKILIVSEEEKSTNEFSRAFEYLKSARRIYFLGFGYHTTNLKKLKLNKLNVYDNYAKGFSDKENSKLRTFRGSALGLKTSQRTVIERGWGIGLPNDKLNDLEFLKEYAELD